MKLDLFALKDTFANMSASKAIVQRNPNNRYGWSRNYTKQNQDFLLTERIEKIIRRGNHDELVALSRYYFNTNGLYRRIILYFSTMLLYETMVVPRFEGTTPSKKLFLKSYNKAINFIDRMNVPQELARIVTIMLIDGIYYGLVYESPNDGIIFGDLPRSHCRTRFRSNTGNHILEFDVTYFDTIVDEVERTMLLPTFPQEIQDHYALYKSGKIKTSWCMCPEHLGVAFSPSLDGNPTPFFIQTIPAISRLRDYEDADLDSVQNELSKLVINKIPLDDENELAFELPEIEEIHKGIVSMLRDNPHVDVITTFTDTEVASLGATTDAVRNDLGAITHLVYNEAGISKQLFNNDSAVSLSHSIQNDLALITQMIKPIQRWLTWEVNRRFGKIGNFFYETCILPISHYNREEISKLYIQGAQYGYSKMLAGAALGIKQSDLIALTEVENSMLDLTTRMKPLQSSHTSSGNAEPQTPSSSSPSEDEGGRPEKPLSEESEKTIQNKEAKNV